MQRGQPHRIAQTRESRTIGAYVKYDRSDYAGSGPASSKQFIKRLCRRANRRASKQEVAMFDAWPC